MRHQLTVALAVTLVVLIHAQLCQAEFPTEIVDPDGFSGILNSIALDSAGRPHICYSHTSGDLQTESLRYASKTDGGWIIDVIQEGSNQVRHNALRLDSSDNPRIAYKDGTLEDLKYAFRLGGLWTTETVDEDGNVGSECALALDEAGNPHISYFDGTRGDLRHSTKQDGVWVTTVVDSAGLVGEYTSIEIDPNGNPCISYIGDNTLRYAFKAGDTWIWEVVDLDPSLAGCTSLELDPDGNPHISYTTSLAPGNLKYAHKTGGIWSIESLDITASDHGEETTIDLDAAGRPHIIYYDATNQDLKYAVMLNGTWHLEAAVSEGAVGFFSRFVLDPNGVAHISYSDRTVQHLAYAVGVAAAGVSSEGVPSAGVSIQVFPNPASRAGGQPLTIQWREPPQHGDARGTGLIVVDPMGRLVREIAPASGSLGAPAAFWDFKDAAGHLVATGPYYFKPVSNRGRSSSRTVIVLP